MTTPIWLQITLVAIPTMGTILSPLIVLFAQSRMNQPKQIPDPSHPKIRNTWIPGWALRVSRHTLWFSLISIFVNIGLLAFWWFHPIRVTVYAVISIAAAFTGISINLSWIMTRIVTRTLSHNAIDDRASFSEFLRIYQVSTKLLGDVAALAEKHENSKSIQIDDE
jgi:hypothetical protein